MSLEGLGKDYLQLLSPYLGPYGCMLAMTCKYMRNNIIIKKYRKITQFYEWDGYLELLQWCFRHEWRITNSTDVMHLSILKWKFKMALHDPSYAFWNACRQCNHEIMNYCIKEKMVNSWIIQSSFPIGTIEYLYNRNDIKLTENMWIYHYNYDESVYTWAYRYQCDDNIRIAFNMNIDRVAAIWSEGKFKNIQMMQNYMDIIETTLSRNVCNQLTYEVAKAINSLDCECRDPANHENRKRIKYG
jgi:hypothetical protein